MRPRSLAAAALGALLRIDDPAIRVTVKNEHGDEVFDSDTRSIDDLVAEAQVAMIGIDPGAATGDQTTVTVFLGGRMREVHARAGYIVDELAVRGVLVADVLNGLKPPLRPYWAEYGPARRGTAQWKKERR